MARYSDSAAYPGSVLRLGFWHGARRRGLTRTIATLLSASFLIPSLAFAFEPSSYPADAAKLPLLPNLTVNGAKIEVAPELGRVLNVFQGKPNRAVVYIHDLHCNYEVQGNIARLLDSLSKKNGLRLVGIEGESRPINTAAYSAFPVAEVKQSVADYFLRKGRITGAEYLAIAGDSSLDLQGIETQALYDADKQSLLKFLTDETQGYCEEIRNVLERLKAPLYTVELAKLDHLKQQLEYESSNLETYGGQLLGEAERLGVSLDGFPALARFAARRRLNAGAGTEYDQLLADAEGLDRALREKLYTSPDQRQLDHYLRLTKIIANMVGIGATAADLDYYRAHRGEFAIADIVKFLDTLCYRNAIEMDLSSGVLKLDEALRQAAAFYDVADQRSAAFVSNTLRLMAAGDRKVAVLITGGYHSAQVEAALRREGVSYLTVKPRMTRLGDENPYFSLLRNQRAPIEKLLDQNQDILAPQSAFNPLFERIFRRHWSLVLGMELPLSFMAGGKMTLQEALREAEKVRQEILNAPGPIPFDFQNALTNANQDVVLLTIPNSRFSVIIRKAVVRSGKNSYGYDYLVREDLDNGYEFQIIANEQAAGGRYVLSDAQRTAVLGTARAIDQAALDRIAGQAVKPQIARPSLGERLAGWRTGFSARLAPAGARLAGWAAAARAAFSRGGQSALGFIGNIRQNSARLSPGVYLVGALLLAVTLGATFAIALPAALPVFGLQLALAVGLGSMVYFFAGHPQASPRARRFAQVAATVAAVFIVGGVFFNFGPLVVTSALAASSSAVGGGAAIVGGKAVWLGMIGGVGVFPLLARISRGILNPEKGRSGRLSPEDWDRIERAQAQARTVGYGMPMASGPSFSDMLLRVVMKEKEYEAAQAEAEKALAAIQADLERIKDHPGEDAEAATAALQRLQARVTAAGRAVQTAKARAEAFKRLSGTTHGLAMLGIAWHQGATLPAALQPLGGEESMLAFADEYNQGEILAQALLDGKPLTAEMLQNNTWLAQWVRHAIAKKGQEPETFVLGQAAAAETLHMLAVLWGGKEGKQALALAKAAADAKREKGLSLRLGNPLGNAAFGFQPQEMSTEQSVALAQELGTLTAALGAEVTVATLQVANAGDLAVSRPGTEQTGLDLQTSQAPSAALSTDLGLDQPVQIMLPKAESQRSLWNLQALAGRALQTVRQSQTEINQWVLDSRLSELRAALQRPVKEGEVLPPEVKALRQAIENANRLEKELLALMQEAGRNGLRTQAEQVRFQLRLNEYGKALQRLNEDVAELRQVAEEAIQAAKTVSDRALVKTGRAEKVQGRLDERAQAAEQTAERARLVAVSARRAGVAADEETYRLSELLRVATAQRVQIEKPLTLAKAAQEQALADQTEQKAKDAKAKPALTAEQIRARDQDWAQKNQDAAAAVTREEAKIALARSAALQVETKLQQQVELAAAEAKSLHGRATTLEREAGGLKTQAEALRARYNRAAQIGSAGQAAVTAQSAVSLSWTQLQTLSNRLGAVLEAESGVIARASIMGGAALAAAQPTAQVTPSGTFSAAPAFGGIAYFLRDLLFDWFGLKPSVYNRFAGAIEYGVFWVLLGGTFGSLAFALGLTALPLVTLITLIATPAFVFTHMLRRAGREKTPVLNVVLAGVIAVVSLGLAFSPLALAAPLVVLIAPLPIHILLNVLTAAVTRRQTERPSSLSQEAAVAADDYSQVVQSMALDAPRAEPNAGNWLQRLSAPRSAPSLGRIWNGLEAMMRHSLGWISARGALGALLRKDATTWAIERAQSGRNLALTVRVLLFLGLVRPGQEAGTLILDMPVGRRAVWLGVLLNRQGMRLVDRDNQLLNRPLRSTRFMEMA